MLKVGITGGIGSGKTTVCKIFEVLNIPIYYADDRAKKIMVENEEVISKIKSFFGEKSYSIDGQLNRNYLSKHVFRDQEKLKKLNSIVHPAVWQDTANWMQEHNSASYILYEAAILFETGSYKMMDKIITVYANKELRIKRTIERDDCSREEVIARMDKQMDDELKKEKADYIIFNNEEDALILQVMNLHKELLKASKDLKN